MVPNRAIGPQEDTSTSMTLLLCVVLACVLTGLTACEETIKPKPIKCPKDTEIVGNSPPFGNREYCGRPSEYNREGFDKHGPWRFYWPNGTLQNQGHYQDGLKHGTFKQWAENGQKISQGKYQEDQKQGLWKKWHRNGKKESHTQFMGGKMHGSRKLYDSNGKLKAEWIYSDGELMGRKTD